jgi:hypothetical protein
VAVYDIRIKGQLDTRWAEWFDGLTITNFENDTVQLSGDLVDQAALHGTLDKVRNLILTLISVTSLDISADQQETVPASIEQKGESNAGATNNPRIRTSEN